MTSQDTTKTAQIDLDLLIVHLNDMLALWREFIESYDNQMITYVGEHKPTSRLQKVSKNEPPQQD